jgi:HNH endonuclease
VDPRVAVSGARRDPACAPAAHPRSAPIAPERFPSEAIAPDLPRAERLLRILERDGAACVWCARPLAPGHRDLSLEHVVPRLKGGPAWPENEVAACRSCNRARGHAAPAAWLDACERRGLRPDRRAIEASLLRLRGAIAERGGQRKARPYLDGQLRRLRLG